MTNMAIELVRAKPADVKAMYGLIRDAAEAGQMLPRALSDLYECLRDFLLARDPADGALLGCCALHIVWHDLAEVRSLTVRADQRTHGIGRTLVAQCLADARALGIPRVFALTYVPAFFHKLGFYDLDKAALPHKVWSDCLRCHKYPDCDELAVAIDLV